MALEESHQRPDPQTCLDATIQTAKERAIKVYRNSQKEACIGHCYLTRHGLACGCLQNCEHCHPEDAR